MSLSTLECEPKARDRSVGHWVKLAPLAAALGALGCGGQHLKLAAPNASAGSSYECWEGSGCAPAQGTELDGIDQSTAKTFQLPEQCLGRVQSIVVLDADSSDPVAYVTCAAASNAPSPTAEGAKAAPAAPATSSSAILPDDIRAK